MNPCLMKNILIDIAPHPVYLEKLQQFPGVNVILSSQSCAGDEKIHFFFGDALPDVAVKSPALEFIQLGSVGYSQLYGHSLSQRGVRVCNARGVFDPTI